MFLSQAMDYIGRHDLISPFDPGLQWTVAWLLLLDVASLCLLPES